MYIYIYVKLLLYCKYTHIGILNNRKFKWKPIFKTRFIVISIIHLKLDLYHKYFINIQNLYHYCSGNLKQSGDDIQVIHFYSYHPHIIVQA